MESFALELGGATCPEWIERGPNIIVDPEIFLPFIKTSKPCRELSPFQSHAKLLDWIAS
jgi:hypothetical protein